MRRWCGIQPTVPPCLPGWLENESQKGPATAKSAALVRPRLVEGGVRNGLGAFGGIEAKLTIGAVNDPLEAEADRVAAEVLDRPVPRVWRTKSGQCAGCTPVRSPVWRQNSLDTETRAFFGPRFGYNFGKVRSLRECSSRGRINGSARLHDQEWRTSPDSGRYQPNTGEGRRLAHD